MKNLRRISKEWAKYRAVSFHLNKGTNQTKYHLNVDSFDEEWKKKDTESINYAYFAFHIPIWDQYMCIEAERGRKTLSIHLHNQVSATVLLIVRVSYSYGTTESHLGIICLSKCFMANQFFSLLFFVIIILVRMTIHRIVTLIVMFCVIATQRIPLFMTLLFCIRDFFYPFFL